MLKEIFGFSFAGGLFICLALSINYQLPSFEIMGFVDNRSMAHYLGFAGIFVLAHASNKLTTKSSFIILSCLVAAFFSLEMLRIVPTGMTTLTTLLGTMLLIPINLGSYTFNKASVLIFFVLLGAIVYWELITQPFFGGYINVAPRGYVQWGQVTLGCLGIFQGWWTSSFLNRLIGRASPV
jgi:hypothetical protein